MALDDEPDPERPRFSGPLPPEDRLWRHPSEVGGPKPPRHVSPLPPATDGPRRAMAVAALASACLAGAVVAVGVMWVARPTKVVVRNQQVSAAQAPTTASFGPAVGAEALASRYAPSLVTVHAGRNDDWSQGTGIWLDDHGTVAVASPVVADATEVMVSDRNGTQLEAQTIASDPATGVTVLKVAETLGTPIDAPAASARSGQAVVTIGAADGGDPGTQRVVTAAVSAVGVRTTVDPLVLHDAVQLDRSVPATSVGCVVVDDEGNLLAIVLSGADADQLAIAVPAAEALDAARDLRDHRAVRRAWLGVHATDLGPADAQALDLDGGALLTEVDAGSPAAGAGLRPGDVITEIDRHDVTDASDLVLALRAFSPGASIDVTWQRDDATTTEQVVLGG